MSVCKRKKKNKIEKQNMLPKHTFDWLNGVQMPFGDKATLRMIVLLMVRLGCTTNDKLSNGGGCGGT